MTHSTAERGTRARKPAATIPGRLPAPLAVAFFCSGVSALVFELLWFRVLGEIFGSTAAAAATLLSAYLFGLGLGAWVIGRLSDGWTAAMLVRTYVAIELGIGAYGVLSKWLFDGGALLYASAYRWSGGSGGTLLFARFAVSFLLIAVPTVLMGGTFPLMVRLLRSKGTDDGQAAGRAYACNTAGAAAGALALPLIVLPALGVTWSLVTAAAGNLAAAFAVRKWSSGAAASDRPEDAPRPAPPSDDGRLAPLLAAFFVSSFASLALETLWTRHLGILFGGQVHTFAFILVAYLVGLFLGGALYARLGTRLGPRRLLGGGLLLVACTVAASLPFLDTIVLLQAKLLLAAGVSYGAFLATYAAIAFLLVLPPALGFGLVFPAVIDLVSRSGVTTGRSVALAYAVNTLGTTLGAAVAGFVLVPAIGSQRSFELMVVLVAGASIAALWTRPARGVPRIAFAALFALVFLLPRWDWSLANAGYTKGPRAFLEMVKDGSLAEKLASVKQLALDEGTTATVAVYEAERGERWLAINGKADASDIPSDMVTQYLLGAVPPLFHDAPRTGLVVGLGAGVTARAMLAFPFRQLDVAEISPEVAANAKRYFGRVNAEAFTDPRVRLHLDDGRNFLRFQPPASYDVIVSEPSNPWVAGMSALFTDEYFADVYDKLRANGVACVWFHNYDMKFEHVRMVARTFIGRFPQSMIMVVRGRELSGDMLMIGAKGPLVMRLAPDDPALPAELRRQLADFYNGTAPQMFAGLVATPGDRGPFAGEGALNTDDHPRLELSAPADRFEPEPDSSGRMLGASRLLYLPIALPRAGATPADAVAAAGFALAHGLPEGREVEHGAFVLARLDAENLPHRWGLQGSRFESPVASTGLYYADASAANLERMGAEAEVLASSAPPAAGGRLDVSGHEAGWVEAVDAGQRHVVVFWHCPELKRNFFVDSRGAAALDAPSLAARYSCRHGAPPASPQ